MKTIIVSCVVSGIVIATMEVVNSMSYAAGVVSAFHEIQKNSDIKEVKVKVPFFNKKIDFKVSK